MNEDLPIGWVKTQLCEIVELKYGKGLPEKVRCFGKYKVYGSNGVIDFHKEPLTQSSTIIVGRKGSIGAVHLSYEPCWAIDTTYFIDKFYGQPAEFIYYLLKNCNLSVYDRATAIPGLTREEICSIPLFLPPLNEQRRIVEKLDRIFDRLRRARQELSHIKKLIDRYKQAVLTAACSSENYENGEIVDIQSVAHVGTGSTPLKSNSSFYADIGIPWITSAATNQPFVTEASEFVTEYAISECRLRKYPVGTLLVAMYGEGKTRGQVTELAIEATINQACAAIIVNESLACKEYVKLSLQANYLEMRKLAEGGNQPNLNLSKIKNFLIFLPPLEEQKEIVRRIEERFARIDKLEQEYQKAVKLCDRLEQATLAKAFRGELVPQDPNDEPASVLLERIRAERQKDSKRKAVKSKSRPPKSHDE